VSYEVSPPRRPGAVTAAGYLMFLVALLLVVDAVVSFATAQQVSDATREVYTKLNNPDFKPDIQAGGALFGAIIGGVIQVLLAAGYVVLAMLNLRGKNPARIVTWVLAGLGVLCLCGAGVFGAASGPLLNRASTVNGVNPAQIQKDVTAAEPSWLEPTQITLAVVSLLALILVIILLALPASNRFFRKPVIDGVGPFQQYPQQSPYPQPPAGNEPPYPGQPPASDDPPYPGQPSA
jgi:hypothetical protein